MRNRVQRLVIPLGIAVACTGCQQATPPAAQPAAAPSTPSSAAPIASTVDPAHPETKWIGNIPYDVFYDQPLNVAANASPVAGTAVASTGGTTPAASPTADSTPPPMGTPAADSKPPAAASAVNWQELAPMPAIVDEVKQIRVRLERNLQKVSDFNKNTASIAQDGALLAAIAAVTAKHPGDVNWKDKAPFIRDLGYQIYIKADGTGSKPFNATKTPFEDVKRLLDGESPTGEAQPDVPYSDVADRAALMSKLSSTYDAAKANVNTADRLKEEKEKVLRDLAMMNLMMVVMADASYDQADDPRYVSYVQSMLADQKAAAEAANAENFDAYSAAIGKINNTCNECHMIFRTGSD